MEQEAGVSDTFWGRLQETIKRFTQLFFGRMLLYFSSSMKYKLILNFNECLKHLNSLLRVIRVNETTYQGKNYVFAIFGFL